jgi:hypothetical protein
MSGSVLTTLISTPKDTNENLLFDRSVEGIFQNDLRSIREHFQYTQI